MEFTTYKERIVYYRRNKTKNKGLIKRYYLTDEDKMNIAIQHFTKYHSLSLEEIAQVTKKREIVEKRQTLYYILRSITTMKTSLRDIVIKVGHGDSHCNVLHSIKTVNNLLSTNKEFKEKFIPLEKKINEEIRFREANLIAV